MTTQHTPGLWNVSPLGNVMKGGCKIATIEQMPSENEAERKANASLIASSPDMYDALQAIVDAFGDQDSLLIDQCKAALNKANGEVK